MRNQRKILIFTNLVIFTFYWYFSFVIITTSFREIKIIKEFLPKMQPEE